MTDLEWLRSEYEDRRQEHLTKRRAEVARDLALLKDVELTPAWEGVKRRLEEELARLEARS